MPREDAKMLHQNHVAIPEGNACPKRFNSIMRADAGCGANRRIGRKRAGRSQVRSSSGATRGPVICQCQRLPSMLCSSAPREPGMPCCYPRHEFDGDSYRARENSYPHTRTGVGSPGQGSECNRQISTMMDREPGRRTPGMAVSPIGPRFETPMPGPITDRSSDSSANLIPVLVIGFTFFVILLVAGWRFFGILGPGWHTERGKGGQGGQ